MNPVIYLVIREGYARGSSVEAAYWTKERATSHADTKNAPLIEKAKPFAPTYRYTVESVELF